MPEKPGKSLRHIGEGAEKTHHPRRKNGRRGGSERKVSRLASQERGARGDRAVTARSPGKEAPEKRTVYVNSNVKRGHEVPQQGCCIDGNLTQISKGPGVVAAMFRIFGYDYYGDKDGVRLPTP